MKRLTLAGLAVLSLAAFVWAAEPGKRFDAIRQLPATEWERKGGGAKAFWCPMAPQAPVLDGKLDDACWVAAGKALPFIKADGGMAVEIKADYSTQVLACRDAENLYMAWIVNGDIAKEIASSPQAKFRNDLGNYKDCYSVAFKMLGGDNEYTFFMNSKGNTGAVSLREDNQYKGAFSAKSAPTDTGAIIELAIPFSNPGLHAPRDGEWWQVQLNRVSNYEWSAQNIQFCAFDYLYFGPEKEFRRQELPIPPELKLYGERYIYYKSDMKTQFTAALRGKAPEGATVLLQLLQGDKALDKQLVPDFTQPYFAFLFDPRGLGVGAYQLRATLQDKGGRKMLEGDWPFTVADQQEAAIPFPAEGVRVTVHGQNQETAVAAWPVSTGVPLPCGAIRDASELTLLENGKPAPANIIARATWYPALQWNGSIPRVDDGNSLKWVGLSFTARYDGGKPRTYVLAKTTAPRPASMNVSQDDTQIAVTTGPARLAVSRKAFDGIHAWLDRNNDRQFTDDEKMLLPGGGPFVVDQDGARYRADKVEAYVEEQGPARVVVALKGWHHSANRPPLCIYQTRITAFQGLPFFAVNHRTILTCDNRKLKLADIGFALRTPAPTAAAFGTMDNAIVPARVQRGAWSSSLHQERSNRFRVIHETPGNPAEIAVRDGRASGLAAISGPDFAVSVFLQDAWEKYPKELEATHDGLTLHFWPRHGYDAFTQDEMLARENLHKALFSHTGRLLSLQIPDSYLQRVREMGKGSDGPQECLYGYGAPGQGVVISNDFVVLLEAKQPAAPVLTAGVVRQSPGAFADPAFACATDVFEKIHPQDFQNFPRTERALEKGFLALQRFVDISDGYGMFLYAGINTSHSPGVNYPTNLARLWANSHYGEARTSWLLYFRSGSPDMLKWARTYSENFMNVGTCNYDDPAHPLIASNPDGTTKGFHVPMAGQQFHCKSPVPWGGPMASNGHFIDPDSFFMRYCLTGDYAAMDTYRVWASCITRTPVDMTPHRDTNNTIAHLLEYYQWSWDPYVLPMIHQAAVPLLNTPFAKHNAGHFHKYWVPRYVAFTRDPRAIERAKEWAQDMGVGGLGWQVDAPAAALLYRVTGDRKYLPSLPKGPAAYDNPDDPWDGYNEEGFAPYPGFFYASVPGAMHAVHQAGLNETTAAVPRGLTPQMGAVFKDRSGQDADVEVLLLRKDDRAFELTLQNAGCNEAQTIIRLLGADGKPVVPPVTTKYDGRYIGSRMLRVPVPQGQPTGLLQLAMRGGRQQFSFLMPATDLDGEAAVLRENIDYKLCGPAYAIAPRPGAEQPVTLLFTAANIAVLRLLDSKGAEVLNTSIAKGLRRTNASITADPLKNPLPWTLEVQGAVQVRVQQADRLYLAPDPKRLKAILDAFVTKE